MKDFIRNSLFAELFNQENYILTTINNFLKGNIK